MSVCSAVGAALTARLVTAAPRRAAVRRARRGSRRRLAAHRAEEPRGAADVVADRGRVRPHRHDGHPPGRAGPRRPGHVGRRSRSPELRHRRGRDRRRSAHLHPDRATAPGRAARARRPLRRPRFRARRAGRYARGRAGPVRGQRCGQALLRRRLAHLRPTPAARPPAHGDVRAAGVVHDDRDRPRHARRPGPGGSVRRAGRLPGGRLLPAADGARVVRRPAPAGRWGRRPGRRAGAADEGADPGRARPADRGADGARRRRGAGADGARASSGRATSGPAST